jgi:hypothetical protein
MGVVAEEAGFLGVATYEPAATLHAGKVLRVEILVTFELTRRAPVRAVLCEALDRLALLLGCDAVAVSVPSRSFLALVGEAGRLQDESPLAVRHDQLSREVSNRELSAASGQLIPTGRIAGAANTARTRG